MAAQEHRKALMSTLYGTVPAYMKRRFADVILVSRLIVLQLDMVCDGFSIVLLQMQASERCKLLGMYHRASQKAA